MIQIESAFIDGRMFIHTYSDEQRYVVRNGVSYVEAYDPPQFNRTYTEGDPIPPEELPPQEEEPEEPTVEEILNILLGGE